MLTTRNFVAGCLPALVWACEGPRGPAGEPGSSGTACTVADNGDGTKTISCEDGTTVTVSDGTDGTSCTLIDGGATITIACDDGSVVTLPSPRGTGLLATLELSPPGAGGSFTAGERIVATVTLTDAAGLPLEIDDLSRVNLYMYGPQGVTAVRTALGLLGASADRSQQPHHYVDLKAQARDGGPRMAVDGNVLTYSMDPISDEEPGTYTIGLWAARADDNLAQVFALADVQIGTDVVEEAIVGRCADCHLGASNGKMYLHHIDPGYSPTGNWAIDSVPVGTCKACHNLEGYAAFSRCSDGSVPDRSTSPITCASGTPELVSDPIVRRVHGVHNGANLASPFDTDPVNGDFRDYLGLVFPAGIGNCTKCHLDDAWKDRPSRLACGACHDDVDFVTGANHEGGAQRSDANCIVCHADGSLAPIAARHRLEAPATTTSVELSLSPPANGAYYAGEQPVVTIVLEDAAGNAIAPASITDTSFRRFNLFVSGPRARRRPVLTAAAAGVGWARAQVQSGRAPWDLSAAVDLALIVDGAPLALSVPAALRKPGVTADEVVAWLNADATFAPRATALKNVVTSGASAGTYVQIRSDRRGGGSSVELPADPGDVQALMQFPTTLAVPVAASYASNDLRLHPADPVADDDPRVTRTATEVRYRLDDTSGLPPGTYVVWVEAGSTNPAGWALATFQVGTAVADPKIATNCLDCHEDTRMHAGSFAAAFDTDICGSCHDYERQITGRVGWSQSNWGFGAGPLMRRIHGVHRLAYLDKPQEVHSQYAAPHNEIIFPQDIRNCVKCHAESDSWMEKPSRLACLACHDDDGAIAHGALMTYDPTPADPWSGDELESCHACHGPGDLFGVEVLHDIADPYRPPYLRDPE